MSSQHSLPSSAPPLVAPMPASAKAVTCLLQISASLLEALEGGSPFSLKPPLSSATPARHSGDSLPGEQLEQEIPALLALANFTSLLTQREKCRPSPDPGEVTQWQCLGAWLSGIDPGGMAQWNGVGDAAPHLGAWFSGTVPGSVAPWSSSFLACKRLWVQFLEPTTK